MSVPVRYQKAQLMAEPISTSDQPEQLGGSASART
jgi:hypothetical protein